MCDLPLEERHISSKLLLQVDKILKESILHLLINWVIQFLFLSLYLTSSVMFSQLHVEFGKLW